MRMAADLTTSLNDKIALIRQSFIEGISAAIERLAAETRPVAAQSDAVAAELDAAFEGHRHKILQMAATAGMLNL